MNDVSNSGARAYPRFLNLLALTALTASFLVAASAPAHADEVPAATSLSDLHDADRLEAEFQSFITSGDRVAALTQRLDHLRQIDQAGQKLLREFDAALEKATGASSVLAETSYAKLQAVRNLGEHDREFLVYAYQRSLELRQNDATKELAASLGRDFVTALPAVASQPEAFANLLDELSAPAPATAPADAGSSLNLVPRLARTLSLQTPASADAAATIVAASDAAPAAAVEDEIATLLPSVQSDIIEPLVQRDLIDRTQLASGWLLTFDDGPSNVYTPQILSNLATFGLHARFFWLAQNVGRASAVVQRAESQGMTLCNHSYTHALLTKLGAAGLHHEIVDSTAVLTRAYGFRPQYYRCPYGACGGTGSQIRQMVAAEGMSLVFWNVDSLDWQDHNPASVAARVRKQMASRGGGIILFHDIHPQSVTASRMIMQELGH